MKNIKSFIFPLVIICVVVLYVFGIPYIRNSFNSMHRIPITRTVVDKNYEALIMPRYSTDYSTKVFHSTPSFRQKVYTGAPRLNHYVNRSTSLLHTRNASSCTANECVFLNTPLISQGVNNRANITNSTVGVTLFATHNTLGNVGLRRVSKSQGFDNIVAQQYTPFCRSFPDVLPPEPGASGTTPLGDMVFPFALLAGIYILIKKRKDLI